jgi:hypothetical protein
VYNNALLQDLHNQELGFMIGRTYVGCPPCADDIALLSNNVNELQDMLLTLHRHSRQDSAGVSKWAGTRYFYPPEIVYSTGRNYWTPQN